MIRGIQTKNDVILGERSETRDPSRRQHGGSRLGALLTQRLAGMTRFSRSNPVLPGLYASLVAVRAMRTTSDRLRTFIFSMMRARWISMVRGEMPSS